MNELQRKLAEVPKEIKKETPDMAWTNNFVVSKKEAAKLSDPEWVHKNLIIRGHLAVYPAPPNGGKTTIFFYLAGKLTGDYDIYYVNADVSGGDAKNMINEAKEKGFTLLLPDMKPGLSMNDVLKQLVAMNNANCDYSSVIFIFDTLKKMTDVISKQRSKELYKVLRGLSAKGMTIVLLSHTNKYKGDDGKLIFEGTGDLRSDVDELIYLIPQKNPDGSMTVSTDPDKVRGRFEPITFEISPDRKVTQSGYVDVSKKIADDILRSKDTFIIDAIQQALSEKLTTQIAIAKFCNDNYKIGIRSTVRVLKSQANSDNNLWRSEKGFQKNRINYYPLN